MDRIDRKILDLLQQDGTLSVADVGHRVGLSQTPCWKRIQRLEAEGVIQRRVALLDPEKLGLSLRSSSASKPETIPRTPSSSSSMRLRP